jgi:hypothetical protein
MVDEEDLVEAAEEEVHNQWSTDKEYSAANSPLLHHPPKVPSPAMLLNSSLANLLPLELDRIRPNPREY